MNDAQALLVGVEGVRKQCGDILVLVLILFFQGN